MIDALDTYYLLALDRTKSSADLVWWLPEEKGYTTNLDAAGIYSQANAERLAGKDGDPLPVKTLDARDHAYTISRVVIHSGDDIIHFFRRRWRRT